MLTRSRKTLFGAALCLAAAFAISACSKKADASAAEPDKSKPALIVNGTVVTQAELDMLLRQLPPQRENPAARQHIIDNLTTQILASQEAVKKGLDKKPEVQNQIEMTKTTVLAQSYAHDFFTNYKPTDADLQTAYDKMKADATGNQYHARHILVKTEDEAKAIIAKLKKDPNAFGDLAKAQSQDPVSKVKGGDLGWFDAKMMVPEFTAAVAKLDKGKFTQEPVKTNFGYHVIFLDDVRPAADAIPSFEQMKPTLTQRATQEQWKKMLEGLKAQAKIETPGIEQSKPAQPAVGMPPVGQPTSAQPTAVQPAAVQPDISTGPRKPVEESKPKS